MRGWTADQKEELHDIEHDLPVTSAEPSNDMTLSRASESDDWGYTEGMPWQELIRIRYVYEVDVLIAGAVQRAVARALPEGIARQFARSVTAISAGVVQDGRAALQELDVERLGHIMRAFDDFVGWCGTPPGPRPHRWQGFGGPDPSPWKESGLAEVSLFVAAAADLVGAVGSKQLQGGLGIVLEETLTALREVKDAV